jgi:hypothetical protein
MNNKTPKQIVEYARANPHREEEVSSNCCGAEASQLSDSLCGSCLEHADFE